MPPRHSVQRVSGDDVVLTQPDLRAAIDYGEDAIPGQQLGELRDNDIQVEPAQAVRRRDERIGADQIGFFDWRAEPADARIVASGKRTGRLEHARGEVDRVHAVTMRHERTGEVSEPGACVQQRPRTVHDQLAQEIERPGRMLRAVPIRGHHAGVLERLGKLDTSAGGPGQHVTRSLFAAPPFNLPPGLSKDILNPLIGGRYHGDPQRYDTA